MFSYFTVHSAVLTSPSLDTNAREEACLGENVTFQCDISGTVSHRWRINNSEPIVLTSSSTIEQVGLFTFRVVDVVRDNTTSRALNITTTVSFIAVEQVNGTSISCEDDALPNDPNAAQRIVIVIGRCCCN